MARRNRAEGRPDTNGPLDATPGELSQLHEFLKTAKDPITICRDKQFWRGL
ncbi:hypothetical protein [Microbacterium mitrae]|uniref:hypothetical protein n=1 Tax=Microbacterium mitrae TaxID=664640 RepID=UPI001C9D65F1|nr:hypothetical protein [Microbacterium mitrae]